MSTATEHPCGCVTVPDTKHPGGLYCVPCEPHLTERYPNWREDAAQFERDHPDGMCTETCGCVVIPPGTSVTEMARVLGLDLDGYEAMT